MKRKLISVLVATAMLATMLTGCGSKPAETEAPAATETEAPAETPAEPEVQEEAPAADETADAVATAAGVEGVDGLNIGVCIYQFADNFMTLYRTELESYLTAGGAKVSVMDGKNDQAEQTNQIQNFITEGVDVLVVNLVQSSAAPQITDQCVAAGIPVVYINREPDDAEKTRWEEEKLAATYVGADARQSGTFQGELILETSNKGDINGDGTLSYIMVQGDPENIDAQYRTEFSVKAITDSGMKVKELDKQRGDWDQARGQEITANALTAYGEEIEVVFCNNDAMALGAAQAIEAAGRKIGTDIYLVGVDALTEVLEKVEAGTFTGTVFNDHIGQSHAAAQAVADFAAGKDLDSLIGVDYIKVTKDNAAEILALLK